MAVRGEAPTAEEYSEVFDADSAASLERKVLQRLNDQKPDGGIDWQREGWQYVIGLDIAYDTRSTQAVASAVLWDVQQEESVDECVQVTTHVPFPYTPGLLAFREVPMLFTVARALLTRHPGLTAENALLLCDGNGTLHPRLCGVACHLGLLLGFSSLGVAKNYHVGTPSPSLADDRSSDRVDDLRLLIDALPPSRGDCMPLYIHEKPAGYLLRTQHGVRPVFVSPGFDVRLQHVCQLVLQLTPSFRLPEPIRRADHIGRVELRRCSSYTH